MISSYSQLRPVPFPEFTGERIYMEQFDPSHPLPAHLARWQPTVDAMLSGVKFTGPAFLMIDQSPVVGGTPHRRPGVHVDGAWDATLGAHKGPRHVPRADKIGAQGLVLASNVSGCAAYSGEYEFTPGEGGDFTHLDLSALKRELLEPGIAYIGDAVTFLHESLPVARDCHRTLVRINVEGWKG